MTNIVIGLGGSGKRFLEAGYRIPKYLIAYEGAPMIYHSLVSLKIPGEVYFVVRQDHLDSYSFLRKMLERMGNVIVINGKTDGAAQTLLFAKNYIHDVSKPLISLNCDQILRWNSSMFTETLDRNPDTSYILTFDDNSEKCSYVRENQDGYVTEVREKKVISNKATVGVYHWARALDYFTDAEMMIAENARENNEFYVAPVYNYSIKRGLKVKTFHLSKTEFHPVGTPFDLNNYILRYGDL